MSVAYDFAPTVTVPVRARAAAPLAPLAPVPGRPVPAVPERSAPRRLADVAVLHPPAAERATVRLTRRGMVVLSIALASLAGALVWVARASAPQAAAPRTAPHVVVVQPGDTLWDIAAAAAPGEDPQLEVGRLMHRNHLTDAGALRPGMQLQVP
jgi:predicted Zn-dependent protease